jgi:hypothetical protein
MCINNCTPCDSVYTWCTHRHYLNVYKRTNWHHLLYSVPRHYLNVYKRTHNPVTTLFGSVLSGDYRRSNNWNVHMILSLHSVCLQLGYTPCLWSNSNNSNTHFNTASDLGQIHRSISAPSVPSILALSTIVLSHARPQAQIWGRCIVLSVLVCLQFQHLQPLYHHTLVRRLKYGADA